MDDHRKISLKIGALEIDDLLQSTISILGQKGSGKTNTAKMITWTAAEQTDISIIVIDTVNVIRLEGFNRVIVTKENSGKGRLMGGMLQKMKPGERIIISLVGMLQTESSQFVNEMFGAWASPTPPRDTLIVVDEGHEYAPESGSGSPAPEFIRAVRHWRNHNDGFVITEQRPAQLDKDVLAMTDSLILYRLAWSHDTQAVKAVIAEAIGKERTQQILSRLPMLGFLQGYNIKFR